MTSAVLHAALVYQARGFSVLPVSGKRPHFDLLEAVSGSTSVIRLRTTPAEEDEIVAWYQRDPRAGVAIITGRPSGIAVADIEGGSVSAPGAQALLQIRTPTATTPSGGRHLYLRLPGALPTQTMPWGELRADGAYVVAPSGRPERVWEIGLAEAGFVSLASIPALNSTYTSALDRMEPYPVGCGVRLLAESGRRLRICRGLPGVAR
jgi:hypothetical protein